MSATLARQEGQLQLEQSNRHLAMNTAKTAKRGFLHVAMEKMQYLINNLHTKVQQERMW
jgi:hypothetical protein